MIESTDLGWPTDLGWHRVIPFGGTGPLRYTRESITENAIEKANLQIANRTLYGRMDPTSIDLRSVTHLVRELEIRDDGVYAKLESLMTPAGNELAMLVNLLQGQILFKAHCLGQVVDGLAIVEEIVSVNAQLSAEPI